MEKLINKKLVDISGVDKSHLKNDSKKESNVTGNRKAILCNFGLDKAVSSKFVEDPIAMHYEKK